MGGWVGAGEVWARMGKRGEGKRESASESPGSGATGSLAPHDAELADAEVEADGLPTGRGLTCQRGKTQDPKTQDQRRTEGERERERER